MWNFLRTVFGESLMTVATRAAQSVGLTEARMRYALELVEQARSMPQSNDEKREWAVKLLMAAGLREALSRLAVELAVVVIKFRKA